MRLFSLEVVSVEWQEKVIRVVFKTQPQKYEKLKDKISQWKQVSNIQFRKQRKINQRPEDKQKQSKVQTSKPIQPN